MKKFRVVAKTLFGFEDLLEEELKALGIEEVVKATRAVSFEAGQRDLYKVNLWSRLALRFMVPIKSFACGNEQELYNNIREIAWEEYMGVDDTLAVDAVVNRSAMDHSLYVSLKTKDAIVDRFREKFEKRPSVDLVRPSLRINVHLSNDQATVSLDSSGESLHKRGYRQQQGEAPLNEVLAAGMIQLTGWDRQAPLVDLMCGSGTILIEAGMLAGNRAPGLLRPEFAFERWKDYDAVAWEELREEAKKAARPMKVRMVGSDKSHLAVKRAQENAMAAGLDKAIEWISLSFEDYTADTEPGIIITNPPYGARLSSDDLFGLYKGLGDAFKKKYSGFSAWVLTANSEAAKHIGLRPSRKIQLFNGSLECRFLKFDLYAGTKKIHKLATKDVPDETN
jgi:23S rRNA (guanine2445-N2)-methyltransferase